MRIIGVFTLVALFVAAFLYLMPGSRYVTEMSLLEGRDVITVAYQDAKGVKQIFSVTPDGSKRVQLTHNDVDSTYPAWSPDGKRIAYVAGDTQIRLMNADGSNDRPLSNIIPNEINTTPRWSPCGTMIAYTSGVRTNPDPIAWPDTHIWVMQADGSDKRQLTSGDFGNLAPTWSPDGAHIAFASNRNGGTYHIWRMNVDGTNPVQLTYASTHPALAYPIEQKMPMWSPDGAHIAFWSGVEMHHITREVLLSGGKLPPTEADLQIARTWHIWLMDGDGGNQRKLVSGDDPAWAPDGTKVLFPYSDTSPHGIGAINIDGSNRRALFRVTHSGGMSGFSWRPTMTFSR